MQKNFVVKGNIISSKNPSELTIHENAFLVCAEGLTAGIFPELPEEYASSAVRLRKMPDHPRSVVSCSRRSIRTAVLAWTRTSVWLQTYAFPEESRYEDPDYAERAYRIFVEKMRTNATTRACIFATAHVPATLLLMEMLGEERFDHVCGQGQHGSKRRRLCARRVRQLRQRQWKSG